MIKLLLQVMTKLLITFLLCCLGVACAGAFDDNSNGNVELGENLLVDHLLVKREAEKKNKGKGKTNGGKGREGNKEKKPGRKAKKPNKSGRKAKKSKKSGRKAKKSKKSGRKVKKPKKGGRKAKKPKKSGRKAKNPKESGRNAKKPKKSGRKAKKPKKSGRKAKKPKTHGKKAKKQKKGGRKAKKQKKGGRKAKKPKISGRKKPKNGIGRNNKSPRQSVNYTSCVAKFIEYSRINELKATSIEKQVNRINSFKGIQDKKTGKKGDFEGTYNTLLSALGGNESAPECDGKPINGSSIISTLSTLKGCEANIKKVCNYEINSTFNSTLQACLSAAKQFKKEFKVCFDAKKSSAEACTCVDTIDTANYKKLKACDTKNANDDIKIRKKACIKGFIVCKTAQDDSVDGVGSCKKVNRCGGAANKTEAARLLKILTPLKDALANTKFADALKKLGLNTGSGSDGKLPATNTTRLNQLRLARFAGEGRQSNTTDGKGCTDIAAEWNNFNTSGDKAVPGVDGDVDSTEVNNTVGSLNKINNRDNLETDLGSCAKEDTRQITITFTIVKIRFYVFWCGWFQVFVVEIKITIITISFGLPPSPPPTPPSPPTIAPAPTPVATSAPGGGRHIVKQIMKRAAFSKK